MPGIFHIADLHASEFSPLAGIVRHAQIPGTGVSCNAVALDLIRTEQSVMKLFESRLREQAGGLPGPGEDGDDSG